MFSISDNHKNSFKALAYVIERKLLQMQTTLVAHRHQMRFVHIHYSDSASRQEIKSIEDGINTMYDLLEKFCNNYNIPAEEADLKNELAIKANFLWEDISGAATKSLRSYGALDEDIRNDYELKITEMIEAANNLIKQFN